mmetsp:Transcript_16377/g.52531  ORF Transcript_16377/g.52531 Transcript_16377/m.52531 type:complete len:573 (-) Transcript_16377:780-2498(-)
MKWLAPARVLRPEGGVSAVAQRLHELQDGARALADKARVRVVLAADRNREEAPAEPLEHRGPARARRHRREHVLVVVVVANREHEVDGPSGVGLGERRVGKHALVDGADAHLDLALAERVQHRDASPLELLLESDRQLPRLEAAVVRVGVVVAPDRGRLLPAHVDAVGAQREALEDRPRRVLPPLLRRRQLALEPLAGARPHLHEAEFGAEPEPVDVAETRLEVGGRAARDDVDLVARVRGERGEAVQRGGRRRQRVVGEVVEHLSVVHHLLLLDERAVEAEEDEPPRRLDVGTGERLDVERRQLLARPHLGAEGAAGEGGAGGGGLAARVQGGGTPHVLHGHVQPGAGGVGGDEAVVLGEACGALRGRHRERGVELLNDVLEVEGVDADAAVEDVRTADELGEDDDARGLLRVLGVDVLEREQVEAVLHRAVEEHVHGAEEGEPRVLGPQLGVELRTNLKVADGVGSERLLDAADHLAVLDRLLRRLLRPLLVREADLEQREPLAPDGVVLEELLEGEQLDVCALQRVEHLDAADDDPLANLALLAQPALVLCGLRQLEPRVEHVRVDADV